MAQEVTIDQAMALALQWHQAGQLQKAEAVYRQVLAQMPNHSPALHLLGVLARQAGQPTIAADLIAKSIAINPNIAEVHRDWGDSLKDQGKLEQAISAYSIALDLKPDWAEGHGALGNALKDNGELDNAILSYRTAIELKPELAGAHINLGIALHQQGKLDESIAAYDAAIRTEPRFAEAFSNMGNALMDAGRTDEAITAYNRAVELRPNFAEALVNLGSALRKRGKLDAAISAYRKAIAIRPNLTQAHTNLGNALKDNDDLDGAVASYEKAVELNPKDGDAFNNLGNAFKDQGYLDKALAAYDRAILLKPTDPVPLSNRICAMHFDPKVRAQAIYEEARKWNNRHATALWRKPPHFNDRNRDRRLRIGYVSPDFREHPIGRFILPLLQNHDSQKVEITCYSDVSRADHLTAKIKSAAHVWRNIYLMGSEAVELVIRADRIDILIDLSMHMANNRLLVFARKHAPVQVTWLAYCSTTGLDAIDYRLTDPFVDPLETNTDCYSEKTVRLPETNWCYQPSDAAPELSSLPSARASYITFGCLNNFAKVSDQALQTWIEILKAVPRSRLILHTNQGTHRGRVERMMSDAGIDADRLAFVSFMKMPEYFQTWQKIDIALDPFPYAGGTTTCDALWMGVPVITLAGKTAAGRPGVSLLSNVGLTNLVANDLRHYGAIARNLARDTRRLTELRSELRDRMKASALCDATKFAWSVEQAYRAMWRGWCDLRSPLPPGEG